MPLSLPAVPVPVSLRRLLPGASFVGCGEIIAANVTDDSRQAGPDSVFAAIPGTKADGAVFVPEAVSRGCTAVLTSNPLPSTSVRQCIVPDVRSAYAKLCQALYGYPAARMQIAGVTGTNGKTTTAWMIRSLLTTAGRRCGLLGTVEYSDSAVIEPASLTTPDPKTAAHWFRRMLEAGCSHAAIELSSHALHQGRLTGVQLNAAVITNITQDHFDYHPDIDEYTAAKGRIIQHVTPGGVIVLNVDDPGVRRLLRTAERSARRVVTTSIVESRVEAEASDATIKAIIENESLTGTEFVVLSGNAEFNVRLPLPARHNVSNALAAIAVAQHFGLKPAVIAESLATLPSVPGRLEPIESARGIRVFVDYAHTDDALRRVVDGLKSLTDGRVICVFGAGGDRDRRKRPLLGEAASHADFAVVTSDNPRTEPPHSIIEDIVAGFPVGFSAFHIEPDRRRAIEFALSEARAGDCVLIAGKGHEREQIVGTERLPFDDRSVVKDLLARSVPAPKILRSNTSLHEGQPSVSDSI
jgi:UDP-N-acetylmuramoyl-L-alanyl-D-glutamate--2,6-diaminopimelate ligase